MALLVYSTPGPAEPWIAALRAGLPDLDIRTRDEAGDPADIEFAVLAMAPPGALAAYPNLKLAVCLLAGVEKLLEDPDLPDIPIVRAGAPDGDELMSEFALLHVLRHHRNMPEYVASQRSGEWARIAPKPARERTIGFMGLGNIGLPAAQRIRDAGFAVRGWSRNVKSEDGIETFHGSDGLAAFLGGTDILVNLLALTPETEDILNAETLALLAQGAAVINLARGQHIVDEDLVAALDSGHLAGATLDVFRREPLPPDHPFWAHPRITITPHSARSILPDRLAPQIVDNVRRVQAGEAPLQRIDRAAGY